jgi:hypothetical protein
MKTNSNLLNWLETEMNKDKVELEKSKMDLINQLKNTKKEDILPKKVKLTLWQRIKKVLTI